MMRWQHETYFEDHVEAYKQGKTNCTHGGDLNSFNYDVIYSITKVSFAGLSYLDY